MGGRPSHADCIARSVEAGLAVEPVRQRSLHQVFGCTPQRDEELVVVRINRRCATPQVGQDGDAFAIERELAALGGVT